MIIKPCAYCGEMPSEGSTIIHLSGRSLCRVAGTVFTPEQWNTRPGEDAARIAALEEAVEAIERKAADLVALGIDQPRLLGLTNAAEAVKNLGAVD